MKKYLSIGEVVKMKGVTHRMLRHYDELGILTPAHINEDTGYRYYSKSQMIILDLILICVELGIPLKEFNGYYSKNGQIEVQRILSDGQRMAKQKLKKIADNLCYLESLEKNLMNTEHLGASKRYIEKRYFYALACPYPSYDIENYWENIAVVYSDLIRLNLTMLAGQGALIMFGKEQVYKTYIEIKKPDIVIPEVIVIEEGHYTCEVFEDDEYEEALAIYDKPYPEGTVLIIADVYEKTVGAKIPPFEIQLLEND